MKTFHHVALVFEAWWLVCLTADAFQLNIKEKIYLSKHRPSEVPWICFQLGPSRDLCPPVAETEGQVGWQEQLWTLVFRQRNRATNLAEVFLRRWKLCPGDFSSVICVDLLTLIKARNITLWFWGIINWTGIFVFYLCTRLWIKIFSKCARGDF